MKQRTVLSKKLVELREGDEETWIAAHQAALGERTTLSEWIFQALKEKLNKKAAG